MATNKDDTTDAESTENASTANGDSYDDAVDERHGNATGGHGGLPLSRRDAILTGVGLGGLGLFGSQVASASHRHPQTKWNRHQSGQGEYTLFNLAGLNMAVMPREQDLEDFEGSGLQIEEEDDRNKLTVNFDEADLDRRYLSWNNDEKALDFTGAAEWENEVDDFSGSGAPNSASGTAAVAAGGDGNDASGDYSTVPGGQDNTAGGAHSFAAGEGATANENRSFVWATGNATSREEDSVLFQAAGGAFIEDGDLDVEDGTIESENDVTARTGDVTADDGSVTAADDVTARNGDVAANNGSVTANTDVTAETGDIDAERGNVEGEDLIARQNVQAEGDVNANSGDVRALNGQITGRDLVANNTVRTESISSADELLLDVANEVKSQTDLSVDGDLHVTGTKHFVTAVETPSGPKQVAYTSVEAGTPRTQATDVAEITGGRAEIDLPEHFAMVTSEEEPLSVQVTPYASERVHPQVVERSLERIVIEDMGDGPDDYRVAYTINGVREGYENEPVILDQ